MSSLRSLSGGSWIEITRSKALAGSRIAWGANGRAARRRLHDQIEHLAHLRAAADDVGKLVIPLLNVLAERAVLMDEPAPFHRVANDDEHLLVLEGLRDV